MKLFPSSCVHSPCRFYDCEGKFCRRNPPIVVPGGTDHNGYIITDTLWPNVFPDDWCGEGEVKE